MMQNELSSVGVELEKDLCKGVGMRELNEMKSHVHCKFLQYERLYLIVKAM